MREFKTLLSITAVAGAAALAFAACGDGEGAFGPQEARTTVSTVHRSTTTTESRRPTNFDLVDARDGVTRLSSFPDCVIGPLDELSLVISFYIPIETVDLEPIPGGFRCIGSDPSGEPRAMTITASTQVTDVGTALAGLDPLADSMFAGEILVTCEDDTQCRAFWTSPDNDFYVAMDITGEDLSAEWMLGKMRLVTPVVLGQLAAAVDE